MYRLSILQATVQYLIQTSCWHENKSCISIYGPHIKTELLFWCQREVWINVMCHPVLTAACQCKNRRKLSRLELMLISIVVSHSMITGLVHAPNMCRREFHSSNDSSWVTRCSGFSRILLDRRYFDAPPPLLVWSIKLLRHQSLFSSQFVLGHLSSEHLGHLPSAKPPADMNKCSLK